MNRCRTTTKQQRVDRAARVVRWALTQAAIVRVSRLNKLVLFEFVLRYSPFALLLMAFGCSNTATRTFPAVGPTPAWPGSPDAPRIRYVGELIGEANVGRRRDALQTVGELFTGAAPLAAFATPMAVAVEGQRIYVADPQHPSGPLVHRLDLAARSYGEIRTAGGAPLEWPIDVAIFGGTLAIADAKRATVFLVDAAGQPRGAIGQGLLKRPSGVAWSADGSELWVLDAAQHELVVFDRAGALRRRSGGPGGDVGRFRFPAGLGARADAAVIADSMNFRVQQVRSNGEPIGAFGKKGDAAGDFSLPRDAALDSEGHIYVLDSQFENVQVFEAAGQLLMAFGQGGSGRGEFSLPSGITIDEQDRIWIADTYNRRVQVFQYLRAAREVQ